MSRDFLKRRAVFRGLALTLGTTSALLFLASQPSLAQPVGFVGHYRILQSRLLSLTHGRDYLLQEGKLVAIGSVDRSRVYCRSAQSTFDEISGQIEVSFETAVDGTERSILKTIPSASTYNPTVIECTAENGFSSALDLSITLGRIVELSR